MGTRNSVYGDHLGVWLLGRFRVQVGDREIGDDAWPLRKAKLLFMFLALAPGHRLHREHVTEMLWPELQPSSASNLFRQALYHARRTLAPHPAPSDVYLRLAGSYVELVSPVSLWIDVDAFVEAAARARRDRSPQAYRDALSLYGGDLLPEARYDDWIAEHRERLRNEYIDLLITLARLYEGRGEIASAIQTYQDAIRSEPVNEEAHIGLMRLYEQTGQRHLAIRQYQLLQRTLKQELDAEPSPRSTELYQQILSGRISDDAPSLAPDDTVPLNRSASYALTIQRRPLVGPVRAGDPRAVDGVRPSGHHLPADLTAFVGRQAELETLNSLVRHHRLVTLTGIGGCGKSRLALEVARRLVSECRHGAWYIDLAPLTSPASLTRHITETLGIDPQGDGTPDVALVAALRSQSLILVLDNCEHVISACRALLPRLLQACPGVRAIATTRMPFRVPGEIVWPVPPMRLPDPREPSPPPHELLEYDAVRLFVDRASKARPGFSLDVHNAHSIVEICQALDGNPLAIEMAAGLMKVISPPQVAKLLGDRSQFFARGGISAPPPVRTLQAMFDWSYELLQPSERELFHRLLIFQREFSWEEALKALFDEGQLSAPLADFSSLVEFGLVQTESSPDGTVRYHTPETLRQYGLMRRKESRRRANM